MKLGKMMLICTNPKIGFLGFTLEGDTYSMEDYALRLLDQLPHITRKCALQFAVGLLIGLRRFILNFQRLLAPFYQVVHTHHSLSYWLTLNNAFKSLLSVHS